jgi:Helicase associated domain
MPTLATELSPQQRAWLFETFGHSGECDELQQVAHYGRRLSDAQARGSDPYYYGPPPTYQHPHHAHIHHPHNHHEMEYSPENRNSIFRRGGRSPTVPSVPGPPVSLGGEQQPPITWSPTERTDFHHFNNRGLPLRQPFHRPSSRVGHAEDPISMKRESEGKRAPVYPHMEEKLTWQQSFENLQVYKLTYGDCNVPQKYRHNVKLGGWVVSSSGPVEHRNFSIPNSCLRFLSYRQQNKQRKKKKNPAKYGKLTETQINDLESLGFKWILDNGC